MHRDSIHRAAICLWAKSGNPPHTLLAHMLDTAAVALSVLRREPARSRTLYAADWELPEEMALRVTALLVGLHDLGKASAAFQALWDEGAERVRQAGLEWDPEVTAPGAVHHGVLTWLYVRDILRQHGLPPPTADRLADALAAHHGFQPTSKERVEARTYSSLEAPSWSEARKYIVSELLRRLGVTDFPRPENVSAGAGVRLMALASFADWIASDPGFFPYGRDPSDPQYLAHTLERAEQALDAIGWTPVRTGKPRSFSELFPAIRHPNALQETAARLVQGLSDPAFVLIEAPMGSGKTEAALYACHLLQQGIDHRGLYVALPTQATANGLFPRVAGFLKQLGGDTPLDIQLQHGTAVLNPTYARLLETARPSKIHDRALADGRAPDSSTPGGEVDEGSVSASAWFSARKRAMLSPHGVGTVDQALLGVLKVKHHFVRLWGLGNRVVVLDELHAYDTYTSGLIQALVRWLKALGSSVIVMSATLTRTKRKELLDTWGASIKQLPPYPRVVACSGSSARALTVPHQPRSEIRIEPAPTDTRRLAQLLKRRLPGALGAIVNTVDRAQELYRALGDGKPVTLTEALEAVGRGSEMPPELVRVCSDAGNAVVGKTLDDGTLVVLLHARFPAEERALRETLALALFGKHGPRPHRAILVATQVAEQSLDLDFDLLYSDLAPIDLLLQRGGRLHRHQRERPEHLEHPTLLVGGLEEDPGTWSELYWDRVYEHYYLLATWATLQGKATLAVPEEVEALLEQVYERRPDDLPDTVRQRARQSHAKLLQRLQQEQQTASNCALSEPERLFTYGDTAALVSAFATDDDPEDPTTQRWLTRLGDPSVPVVPVYRRGDHWFFDRDGKRPAPVEGSLSQDEVLAIWGRAVRVSRYPLPQILQAEHPPHAWQRSGLLRGIRLLEVDRVFAANGKTLRVQLDAELGLVYVLE
jgi:CRISPR-associated endonuclease/helicase Cas3